MRMHKCPHCNNYTLKQECVKCGGQTSNIKPPKYSPEDPYGKYRRMMKKEAEDG